MLWWSLHLPWRRAHSPLQAIGHCLYITMPLFKTTADSDADQLATRVSLTMNALQDQAQLSDDRWNENFERIEVLVKYLLKNTDAVMKARHGLQELNDAVGGKKNEVYQQAAEKLAKLGHDTSNVSADSADPVVLYLAGPLAKARLELETCKAWRDAAETGLRETLCSLDLDSSVDANELVATIVLVTTAAYATDDPMDSALRQEHASAMEQGQWMQSLLATDTKVAVVGLPDGENIFFEHLQAL